MDNQRGGHPEEFYVVLDETLPVIHAALLAYYGFQEEEAEAFEDTLCLWFHRVIRRVGIRAQTARSLQEQLLFVACKYARAFQEAKLKGLTGDPEWSSAIRRSPEEVAIELLGRMQTHGAMQ